MEQSPLTGSAAHKIPGCDISSHWISEWDYTETSTDFRKIYGNSIKTFTLLMKSASAKK